MLVLSQTTKYLWSETNQQADRSEPISLLYIEIFSELVGWRPVVAKWRVIIDPIRPLPERTVPNTDHNIGLFASSRTTAINHWGRTDWCRCRDGIRTHQKMLERVITQRRDQIGRPVSHQIAAE